MGLSTRHCLAKGYWALNLAYAVMGVLTVEDRRAWEQDLLCRYLDGLGVARGPVSVLTRSMVGLPVVRLLDPAPRDPGR